MTLTVILLWIVNVGFDTFGQTAFKFAAMSPNYARGTKYIKNLCRNPWLWAGVITYAIAFLLWLAFLTMVPLSLAILLASVNMITVMIVGRFIFREYLTPLRVAGILLITAGVAIVGFF